MAGQDKTHLKFLSKHFAENGKEKLFLNDSSFLNNLKNAKQIISCHPKFNKFCRRTYLHALMFPISLLKRNLWSHWKWQTFEGKIRPFFMTSKNRDLFSS